jgi:hypothetical protein
VTTPAKTPAKDTPAPSANYADFFAQLLHQLGIQQSTGALQGLADVVHEEGTNSYYNPFNIEYHPGDNVAYKGTGNVNSVGVQEYGSEAQGVSATAAFLESNPRWSELLSALRTGSKDNVDTAFTHIYTWAPFHAGSVNDANNILASKIGTHSVDVSPPSTGENIATGIGDVIGGVGNTIDSIPKLIKWVTSPDNLIRMGFIVLGLLILLIGVDKLTSGGISGASDPNPTETIDVVVGNSRGNTKTAAGKAVSAPARAVKAGTRQGERGAAHSKDTAASAPKRAVEGTK